MRITTSAAAVCGGSLVKSGAPEQHLLSRSSIALGVILNLKLRKIIRADGIL
jgi:hypothetical protein